MDKVIQCISDKLIKYLIKHQYIAETKEDVYYYGTIVAFQSVLYIIAALIIGLAFDLFFENLCFMIVFKLLRKFSGGLHSKTFSICFSVSILLNIIVLFTFKIFFLVHNFMIVISVELVSSLILVLLSPIKNQNKAISKNESRIYKLIVTIICVFVFLFSIILFSNKNYLVYSMCIAVLLDAFFAVLGYFKTLPIVKNIKHKTPNINNIDSHEV